MTKEQLQAEAILKKNWPYNPQNLQNFKDAMKFTYQAIIDSMVEMQAAAAPVPHFPIIQALCRCALADNPSNATRHQVERLRAALSESGLKEGADALQALLTPKENKLTGAKIVRSEKEDLGSSLLSFANWLRPKYPDTNAIDVQTYLKRPTETSIADAPVGEWISVADGLPEVGQHVLLYTEYLSSGEEAHDMFVGYRDEYGECFQADDDSYGWQFDDCVTHWMLLPPKP